MDQLRAAGAPAEVIEAWEAHGRKDEERLVVLDCLREAVLLFMASATQWRRVGERGMMVGLDYAAVLVVAGWLGLEPGPGLLADLRIMEAAALTELHRGR